MVAEVKLRLKGPDMGSHITGGCQCGAIKYESDSDPIIGLHCYCRQCQRITGAGHASQFGLPQAGVRMTGEVSKFELVADSGNAVTSCFCPKCGSPIYKTTSGMPDLQFFHVGTLENPEAFSATRAVWTSQKLPWDQLDPAIQADP